MSDSALLSRLLRIQHHTRDLLLKYHVANNSFSVMARRARQAISNSDEIANLLELLINLQELGSEAKRRGILNEAELDSTGERSSGASHATSRRTGASNGDAGAAAAMEKPELKAVDLVDATAPREMAIDPKASIDFFKNLDREK